MRSLPITRLVAVSGALLLLPLTACPPVEPPIDGGVKPDGGDKPDGGYPPPDGGNPDGGPPPNACGNNVVDPGEECDDGNTSPNDACKNDCTNNVCGDGYVYVGQEDCDDGNTIDDGNGCNELCEYLPPPPNYVTLQGQIRDRKYLNAPPYQANVTVTAINADCQNDPTCTSAPSTQDTGNYSIPGLPPQSALVLQLHYPETYGPNNTPVPAGFNTRAKAATKDQPTETTNLYVVKYGWLAQVAYECGVYDDITNVYNAANYPTAALGNPDWVRYSAVFGQLKDANGNGVAGVDKSRLEVTVNGYVNDTTSRNPNYFCWLQPYDHDANPGTPDVYRGTASQSSYAEGGAAFVVLKVTNAADVGTGAGTQYVRVKQEVGQANFVEQSVPVQAGNVSVVTLYVDENAPPPPPVLVDFETEIMPIFTEYGCVACHYPGGPGAVYADPVAQTYPADFTGDADLVFANLTGPGTTCGAPADANNPRDPNPAPYRVCVDYPKRAKLATKPLLEDPPNHPNASFPDDNDPTLLRLEAWMEQGAPRYAEPPLEPPVGYSLEGVMRIAAETGCTACHGYNTGYEAGLALDGCIQGRIDDGTYAAAGIETDPELNPNYKRDCVYYHLKNQGVATDPYDYGYRVNPDYPERSLLLRNPYCGPTYCANDPQYPETHAVRVFPNTDDARYQAIYSWIEAGALNNADADLE